MKRFRAKRHINLSFFKYLFFIILIFLILKFILCIKFIDIDALSLIKSSNSYSSISVDKIFMNIASRVLMFDINKPDTILSSSMYLEPNVYKEYHYVFNEINNEPLVYIYNTHDTEEYSDGYGVYDASFYLKDKLMDLGINSIVEENRTSTIRNNNGWNYNMSYKASRINLLKVKEENPSIKLFIDLHRDSVSRESTLISNGDSLYAKVLFVVGAEHENFLDNVLFTEAFNDSIVKRFNGLSKGILQKSGPGVNGIYNQDINYNVVLLEVGGHENSSLEVKNTLDVIALAIKERLDE